MISILTKIQRNTLAIALSGGILFFPHAFSANSPETAQLKEISKGFTNVAKEAIPAVVSIKVKFPGKQSLYSQGNGFDDSYSDSFSDNFWQQFFGMPRQGGQQQENAQYGQASGVIVSPDGYILTNNHVVKDATEILITLNDGREFSGKVAGEDSNTDIAVVKIDAQNLPFLKLGNSDNIDVGQWVIAIGNPFGLQATVTKGIVSAKGRNNLDLARIEDFIQTDTPINRGNSGGPLLDLDGEVIGLNTAIVSGSGGSGGYVGIGFAIPSNIAQRIMEQLISKGKVSRGFMGVILQTIDSNLATAFHLNKAEGALVAEVTQGSPADKAGLKQGDIILKYNHQLVSNITSLRNAVALMEPGSKMTLEVMRQGKPEEMIVDIGLYPEQIASSAKTGKLGFEVENITPELASSLGVNGLKGVLVSRIEPNTPASLAGIKKGSLILAVNHKNIGTVDEFLNALKQTESGKPVLLLIKQGDVVRFVSFKVE